MHYYPQDDDEDDYDEPQRPPPAARAPNRQSRGPPPPPKGHAFMFIRSPHGNGKKFKPRRFNWDHTGTGIVLHDIWINAKSGQHDGYLVLDNGRKFPFSGVYVKSSDKGTWYLSSGEGLPRNPRVFSGY
ncbi:hypothetical protein N7456_005818 [Penicillium angulare]|uniref:Uncharacterized protein n=1 Tax=Penicillium angulare TaxID=116970 RepID=A0A9W9FZB5_9EURO|nr:hypothetical protein N7456_005818 [Penicillium angulare]